MEIKHGDVIRVLQEPIDEKSLKAARRREKKRRDKELATAYIIEEQIQDQGSPDYFLTPIFPCNYYDESHEDFQNNASKSNVETMFIR